MLVRLNLYWIWEKAESSVTFWHQPPPSSARTFAHSPADLQLCLWAGWAAPSLAGLCSLCSPRPGQSPRVTSHPQGLLSLSPGLSTCHKPSSGRARTSLGLQVEQVSPHVPHCLHVIPDLGVGVQAQDLRGVGKWQSFYGLWKTTTQTLVTQNTTAILLLLCLNKNI